MKVIKKNIGKVIENSNKYFLHFGEKKTEVRIIMIIIIIIIIIIMIITIIIIVVIIIVIITTIMIIIIIRQNVELSINDKSKR